MQYNNTCNYIISVCKHPFTRNPDPNLQNAEVFVYALSLCVFQPIHHLYASISIDIIEGLDLFALIYDVYVGFLTSFFFLLFFN